jgi:hypothetical protein
MSDETVERLASEFARSVNRKTFLKRGCTVAFASVAGLMGVGVRPARGTHSPMNCQGCLATESPFCANSGHGSCCGGEFGWECQPGCQRCMTCQGNNCWCVSDFVHCQTRCCCDCMIGANCNTRCICTAVAGFC